MSEQSEDETSHGVGLPYLVVKESSGRNTAWGPISAVNPTMAVQKVEENETVKFTQHTNFKVYPVGVGPEGEIECETVSGGDL